MKINTHNLIVDFGKHKGERWTRIPISYLKWLVNETEGEKKEIAEAELKRRGTTTPHTLELSGHAIDRASQVVPVHEWQEEGLHSWLQRIAEEAMKQRSPEYKFGTQERIEYNGYRFILHYGNYYPTLKTIIRLKERRKK